MRACQHTTYCTCTSCTGIVVVLYLISTYSRRSNSREFVRPGHSYESRTFDRIRLLIRGVSSLVQLVLYQQYCTYKASTSTYSRPPVVSITNFYQLACILPGSGSYAGIESAGTVVLCCSAGPVIVRITRLWFLCGNAMVAPNAIHYVPA